MNSASPLFNPMHIGTDLPHYTQVSPVEVVTADPGSAVNGVGSGAQALSDEEREAAAYRAGVAMQAWYSQYQQSGNPNHLDLAYYHLGQMRQILAGRSPEYVAKLEAERGLA